MAGNRRLLPAAVVDARRTLPAGAIGSRGGGLLADVLVIAQQKISAQNNEIQQLLSENQRLAATHVALKQELAAAQREVQQTQQAIKELQSSKDASIRMLGEKAVKMEAELRAREPLKAELPRVQTDIQNLQLVRKDLLSQVRILNKDLQKAQADVQSAQRLKLEVDDLRTEIERARVAVEYEKKSGAQLLAQNSALEKNVISMAREREELHLQLITVDKRGYADIVHTTFNGNAHAMHQGPDLENYGVYDVLRGGALVRR